MFVLTVYAVYYLFRKQITVYIQICTVFVPQESAHTLNSLHPLCDWYLISTVVKQDAEWLWSNPELPLLAALQISAF